MELQKKLWRERYLGDVFLPRYFERIMVLYIGLLLYGGGAHGSVVGSSTVLQERRSRYFTEAYDSVVGSSTVLQERRSRYFIGAHDSVVG
jgi:hypothetical protein